MRKVLMVILLLVFASSVSAQSLDGRNRIELRAGTWGMGFSPEVYVNSSGVLVSSGNNGITGGVGYSKWIRENLALTFSITGSLIDMDVTTSGGGVGTSTNTLSFFSAGARYYFPASSYEKSFRPYVTGSVGPVVGVETQTLVGMAITVDSHSEKALGFRVGGGIDLMLSRSLALGFESGYNFMTDFSEPVGGEKNYSGGDFIMSFSFLFGGTPKP